MEPVQLDKVPLNHIQRGARPAGPGALWRVPRSITRRHPSAGGVAGLLVAVAGFALLTGCGASASGEGTPISRSAPPAPPAVPPSEMPSGGPLPSRPEPAVLDPVAGSRERTVAFRLIATHGKDLVVEVQIGGPPCDTVTGADVSESATQVLVTIWAGRIPGANCTGIPALLGTSRVRVPLAEPLGDRTLGAG